MKTLIFFLICICLLSCEKDNKLIQDGSYSGYLKYGSDQIWESFGIDGNSFVEYASGGVMSQKIPIFCLTKGIYKIHGEIIEFTNIQVAQPPNKELNSCDQDFLLMGSYNLEELSDSVVAFSRNSTLGRQEYRLKLYYAR